MIHQLQKFKFNSFYCGSKDRWVENDVDDDEHKKSDVDIIDEEFQFLDALDSEDVSPNHQHHHDNGFKTQGETMKSVKVVKY